MINDFIKQLFEAVKLGPRHLVAVALVLGFVLFAPADLAQRLGIVDVAKDYRPGIGIGFLLCCALLAVNAAHWAQVKTRELLYGRKFKRELDQRLRTLTEDEKQILRYYIALETRANVLRLADGVVQGLAASGVIFRSAEVGSFVEGFAFNINEIAWQALHKEPELLHGTTNTYRTDKREYYWS